MGGKESCKVYYDLLCTLLPHTCSKYSNYLTFTKNYTKNNHNVLIIIVPSHVEACASVPSCNPLDLDHIKSCLMTPYWPFYSFHLHIGRGEPASQATIPALSNIWVKILIFAPCELETGDWGLGTTTNGTNVLSVLTGDRAPATDLQLPKPQSNNNQSNKRLTVCVMGGRNEEEDLSWNMMGLWSGSRLLRNTFLVCRLQTLPLSAQSSIEKREEGAKWSQTVKT